MKKRKEKSFYKYQCTLTAEEFITTRQAPHPDELVSVRAYYDLHASEDDRPAVMIARLGLDVEPVKPVVEEDKTAE